MRAPSERVVCFLNSVDKYDAIDEVIASCSVLSELDSAFKDAVHKREMEQSTAIGHGVAIAHGRVPSLKHPHIALGLSDKPIYFDEEHQDVHLLFVIASAVGENKAYLSAVSALLSWVHEPRVRNALLKKEWNKIAGFISMLENQEFMPLV